MTRLFPLLAFVLLVFTARADDALRPNILIIVADDMGYSDAGCYGGEIETPGIDRLAEEGVRFANYYVNPMCVVTRTSLYLPKIWDRDHLNTPKQEGLVEPYAIQLA